MNKMFYKRTFLVIASLFLFSLPGYCIEPNKYYAALTATVNPTGSGTVYVNGDDSSVSRDESCTNIKYKNSSSTYVYGTGWVRNTVNFTATATPNTGYSFNEWKMNDSRVSTSASYSADYEVSETASTRSETHAEEYTIIAYFSVKPYTITYAKGDHGSGTSTTQSVNIESDITLLSGSLFTPNDGYEFKEWKVTSLGSTNKKWAMNQTFNSSNLNIGTGYYSSDPGVTLTAQWELITYTITYDANGGSVSSDTQNYTINSTDPLLIPTRNGYTFAGWEVVYYDPDDGNWEEGIAESPLNNKYGDVRLQAKWTLNDYTITYAAGDHSTEGSTTATPYDIEHGFTLAANGYTPEAGWTFDKWKVTTAGSGPDGNWTLNSTYDEGQSIAAGKYGNVTMTAQWKEIPTADITINVTGLESDESAMFTVSNGGGVLYTVVLSGSNPSVTIKDLPTGVQYTVQATNGWSWAYGTPSPTSYVQNLDTSGLVANFAYSKNTSAKKHDEKSNVNWRPAAD